MESVTPGHFGRQLAARGQIDRIAVARSSAQRWTIDGFAAWPTGQREAALLKLSIDNYRCVC